MNYIYVLIVGFLCNVLDVDKVFWFVDGLFEFYKKYG